MTTVCRLCLKPAIDNVSFHYTDNSGFSTTSLVKALVPELYLGLSPNPVVCKSCYFHLRQAYVFRLRCLRSENLIGIYIRETKNTESLVLLDDVVNFWKKRYENKSEGLQCNLEEWFGKGRDKAEAPIILNQIASIVGSGNGNINKDVSAEDKQQEDDTFDLKEISKESKETNSEKEKTAECIGDCSKPKDGISCKFTEFTGEREKRHDKKDYNNDIIVIDDIAKEFDDFINKACMESPEETIKIVMEPDCQTPKVKFNTSPKLVKILTKIKRPKSDKAPDVIESPKDKSKTIKIVVDEESHSSNEQYTAVLKLASKIPTKQCNTTTPMKKNVIEPGEDTDRSINLICDMNDMDINSIVNELRKDENLEKLGFSNSEDDESYFIDKVDNKLSFALLPKHPDNDARKETDIDGGEKTTSLINRNKMDMSNRPPQKKVRNDSVSMGFSGNGKQSEFINDVTGAKEPVKGTSIGGCLDTRLNEGQKDEDKRKKALNENVTEVNLNRKSLERLPILLNDRIESEKDMFPPESEKPPLHPEPVSSTSQDKSPAIPMPIIRVRPASALQKVRTLNHELWPQNEMNNHAEDSFQLLYPMSSPQVPHGLPAKMGDGDTRPSPIVLNSQLDLSGGMASTLKPPPPPKPPSKLKEKRPVLKTYQRKIADGSKVLRRVNPLTYKALEEMQKMGLIKVVGVAEESQINKPIQQSLSYMVKRGVNLVNLDNFLENSGFELENPEGDLGNSGDLRVNSGEHSWDSGDLRGNSEDRRGNSGDLRENSGERSWDSGDLRGNSGDRRGNSGDLRENSEERSWDSGGRRGNSGDIRGNSEDLRENSGDLRANSGDLGGISGASLGNVMDRRGSRDERNEYAIDIKEEPLNCTESDVLMNFGEVDQAAESEGETTRSASETSFMDTLHSQNDLVKTIVENIPDMGEEQYDEPEYVHINNVSFSDLTKMMGESKKHKEIVNSKQMQPPQMNVPKINPMRLKTRITDLMRNELKRTNQSTQAPRPQITKIRAGKRLRLVQVDADGKEIEEVVPRMRRRLEPQSVLKSNVDRRSVRRIGSFNDGNVCVLYTNFTSEGDYINDHDYLVNPYVRNKMFFHHGLASVCICLLCDLKHRSIDHIDHMKSHKTICQVCRVDFHNVFILNLHVKSHSTYCSECERAVTYANHMAHAAEHNKSLTLSNIDVPDDVVPDYLQKSAEGTSQTRKEKQPPSSRKSFPTLAELLREQPLDTNSRLRTSSSSPSVSPRRSRRITRSKKYEEDYIDNEEEACIYDKTTRSFITPSAEKQQKLLEKCYSDNQTTDTSKKVETHLSPDSSIENLKKGDCETQETDITLSSLLCDETIHKTDSETSLIKTDNVSIKQENIIKIEPKKTKKPTKKRRQKRLMMPKKKSKFFPHKTLKPNESQESKNTKSVKLTTPEPNNMDSVNLTNDESSSKPDLSLTKSDLVAVDDVKTVENNEKSSDSGNTEKLSNDSTNTENDTCKSQEVAKSNISESKVTRRSKKSVGMLRKDLVEVKTYSRSSKRKGGGSNADTSISTSPAEKGGEPTVVFTPPSEITDMIDGTEEKNSKNVESPTTNSLTKQKETRASKAGCRKNEPSKSIVKSKMATLKSGKVNKKLLNATLPKSSITTDTLSDVPLDTTIEKDNTKTPVDSTNESRKSTKVFLDGTEASKDTTELCRDSTKIPKKSTKSSKNSEGKSPLRGDLKMKIKSLNYSPFVSLTDVFTEVPNLKEKLSKPMSETKPKVLKVYERTGRTKKVPDDNLGTSPALVDNKLEAPVVNVKVEERLSLSLAVSDEKNTEKHTNKNIDETLKEKDDKNLKSDKLKSNSKARSSRSRGSLGLVEGLKGNEKRGSRKPKKSSTSLQDDSSGNLDTSQPFNEDLQIKLEETTDEAPISCLETVQLKNTAFDEPLVLKNVEADVNIAETSNKSSEASTSDSKELELENNKWLRESSLVEEDKRLN